MFILFHILIEKGKMIMQICKVTKPKLADAISLIIEVFNEFEAPEYNDVGVQTFMYFVRKENLEEMMDKNEMHMWGCYEGNQLVGVAALRGIQHVSLLFVRKSYHRQGVARRLMQVMLQFSKNQNPEKQALTVNASPYGVVAYEHLGFQKLQEEQEKDGIRYTPMALPW